MVVSYAAPLANEHSRALRRLIESDWYKAVFPHVGFRKITEEVLETTERGNRRATTIGGAVTGLGAKYIIMDDAMSATDAHSEVEREAVKRFYSGTLSSRFDDPSEGRMILGMQRLHIDDLSGHLLSRGAWRHLKLQAIATHDQVVDIGPGQTHHVRTGDLLSPTHLSQAFLDDQRLQMGSHAFAAQYQQEPTPATGNMVQRKWLRYYDTLPQRAGRSVVMSLDTATKTDSAHDYSACTVWLRGDGDHHLIDVWRGKLDYPGLKQKVLDLWDVHRADRLIIEDHGSGSALIQDLKSSKVNAIGFKSTTPKESRLSTASAPIEAGKVWLPKEAHWLAAFESELLNFPHDKHDDQADSFSQYIAWTRDAPASYFHADFGRDEPVPSNPYGVNHDYIAEGLVSARRC